MFAPYKKIITYLFDNVNCLIPNSECKEKLIATNLLNKKGSNRLKCLVTKPTFKGVATHV